MNKLLNIYNLSLDYPDVSGGEQLELLAIRDQIATLESEFSLDAQRILFEADKKLIANAAVFYQEISHFINLSEHRKKNNISSQKWWWYLDVLANLSNYLIPMAA
ncbi:MAG: hypothetical protein DCF19_15965 [Pseudanabaena frigida]|uniref:Uncharacterized protein n=1 Tax=Pseudanabaena frigida TaxID=945775 RepID=A0A2W4W5L1_9CYAN|nr:MAG: hypothetical protein DCF19_15965 [Pseudanabaena frigida]